jgi:hypothetical protein
MTELNFMAALMTRRQREGYARTTEAALCSECERLLCLSVTMAAKGGRDSADASVLHRIRIVPLIRTILRTEWDYTNQRLYPMLAKAIDALTSPDQNGTAQ